MTLKRRKPPPVKWKPIPPIDMNTSVHDRGPCPCCYHYGVLEGPLVVNPITGDVITQAVFTDDVLAMCAQCIQAAFLGGTHPHPMRNS